MKGFLRLANNLQQSEAQVWNSRPHDFNVLNDSYMGLINVMKSIHYSAIEV